MRSEEEEEKEEAHYTHRPVKQQSAHPNANGRVGCLSEKEKMKSNLSIILIFRNL